MSRSAITMLLFVNLLIVSSASAQDRSVLDDSERPATAQLFVGAAAGSAAGVWLWWHSGGPFTSAGNSLGRLWLGTTLGTVVGALVTAPSDRRPDVGTLVLGSSVGVIGGLALTLAVASLLDGPDSEAPGGLLVLSFGVGQGAVTTLLGS